MTDLTGYEIQKAFEAGVRCLERYRDIINDLNVFPVPDGDTGTNMLLTMRSGIAQCSDADGVSVSEVTTAVAQGSFWGARGNSGVILSQFFKGFAEAFKGHEYCSPPDLARAFRLASDAAYRAVGHPVEGTMLSVIRAVAEEVQISSSPDVVPCWEKAFTTARDALARTPDQLPVLKQAGVVDAGGLGMVAILGGAWCYFTGQDVEQADLGIATRAGDLAFSPAGPSPVAREFLDASHDGRWGYCIQFLIEGQDTVLERVRRDFTKMADSVVVIGDDQHIRVHLHAPDPGPAISYGVSVGQLSQVKIENMDLQNLGWAAHHNSSTPVPQGIAVVAVAPGDGLARLFRDSGCAGVISGGQTMNPSVQQIREAVEFSGATDVIILPNNKNVVATAELAAGEGATGGRLNVVPSRTVPQGVAALLAFNPAEALEHNLKAMRSALAGVTTVEVTRAVRNVTVGDLEVQAGQHIALVEGELTDAGETAEAALLSALARVGLSSDKVVTMYWGADVTEDEARSAAEELRTAIPGMHTEIVFGGQPHYSYLASVE